MPVTFSSPVDVMRRAMELARRGEGFVEPNPQVGAVIVDDDLNLLGEGYHERFGGPHAEVQAFANAGERARGGTLFVTLEPCCHFGKTPPCTEAVIAAGIRHVVVGCQDPFPQVAGKGIARLRAAGITVEVGLLEDEVRRLNAPFRKLFTTGLPYVHAKWAMTWDGKIAAHTGKSQWITNAASRAVVHRLRGRMDAIMVGSGTAASDNPMLTARPAGQRVATRIVVDSSARLALDSHLVQTVSEAPVLVAVSSQAPKDRCERLRAAGVEVIIAGDVSWRADLRVLLAELGRRQFTNILVEGGSELLGSLFDQSLIDAAHVFIAPKLLGGTGAKGPVGGTGLPAPAADPQIDSPVVEIIEGGDVYLHGPLRRP